MDNPTNPIEIEDESSVMGIYNPLGSNKEEEDEEEEVEMNVDQEEEDIHCVGEINYDQNGNLVEQIKNFCLHYLFCPIHKLPMVKTSKVRCFLNI